MDYDVEWESEGIHEHDSWRSIENKGGYGVLVQKEETRDEGIYGRKLFGWPRPRRHYAYAMHERQLKV
jgi:hypothetical protein